MFACSIFAISENLSKTQKWDERKNFLFYSRSWNEVLVTSSAMSTRVMPCLYPWCYSLVIVLLLLSIGCHIKDSKGLCALDRCTHTIVADKIRQTYNSDNANVRYLVADYHLFMLVKIWSSVQFDPALHCECECEVNVKSPVFPGRLPYFRCQNLGSKFLLVVFSCSTVVHQLDLAELSSNITEC